MEHSAFVDGQWIQWKPLPGLDISMGENALLIGATVYARSIIGGLSEVKAQQLAEGAAFQYHYRVVY
jgi:hypothetical protein